MHAVRTHCEILALDPEIDSYCCRTIAASSKKKKECEAVVRGKTRKVGDEVCVEALFLPIAVLCFGLGSHGERCRTEPTPLMSKHDGPVFADMGCACANSRSAQTMSFS